MERDMRAFYLRSSLNFVIITYVLPDFEARSFSRIL